MRLLLILAACLALAHCEADSDDPYANMGYDTALTTEEVHANAEAETAQKVTRKFEGLDADGDGSLTLQEVAAKEIAEKRAEAEQQFALADADSDGKATHAELFEEKDALRAEELFMLTSKPAAKERFSFADTNNDQALDMTEFHVFAHPRDSIREEEWIRLQVQELLRREKRENKNSLTESEYYHINIQGLDLHETARNERFESVDRNKDGAADEEELVLLFMMPEQTDGLASQFQYLASLANATSSTHRGKALSLDDCLGMPDYFLHMLAAPETGGAALHGEL